QLFVEGDLLARIPKTWNSASSLSNRGHLRLISNLLAAVIGPCPEAYEEDAMGSSDHQVSLITPDHLITVSTNGCTNECDSNPPLRSYLRSNISDETWTSWCEFVRGPLAQANEKSYVNYAEFPNSVASSEQNATEYKLTDLAISQALQNAYSTYCSQPLTTAFTDRFGFAEDEFVETQSHPNLVLDARLSEVSFSLHIHEDTENGTLFEQACNDVIQLNEKEVGLDGIRLPEPTTSPQKMANEPNAVPSPLAENSPEPSETKPESALPSRSKLLEVFNEIQSGLSNNFLDDNRDMYIDEDANSDEDLDAVLVNSPRHLISSSGRQPSHSPPEYTTTPEMHLILNGFSQALRLKSLPTLAETELNEDGIPTNGDDADRDEDGTTDSLMDSRNGFNHVSPMKCRQKPVNGIPTHQNMNNLSNESVHATVGKNNTLPKSQKIAKSRRPTPAANASAFLRPLSDPHRRRPSDEKEEEDNDDTDDNIEVAEHLAMSANTQKQLQENRGNVLSVINGVSSDRTNGDWVEIHRSPNPNTRGLTLSNGTEMQSSPPAVPLSAWKTHMFLTQQSDSLTPSSPHLSLSPRTGLTCDPETYADSTDPIELGDLSAGLSHLTRSAIKNPGILQPKQLSWTVDRLGGAPRSLIMPTKRSTINRSHHEPFPNPFGPVNVSMEHPDRIGRTSPRSGPAPAIISPSSPIPAVSLAPTTETMSKSHSTDYSRVSSHFAAKSPHTSCGITATVKVRHGSKAHNLPPFVISETELIPSDLGTGCDEASMSNTSTPADSLNGLDSPDMLSTDPTDMEQSLDPNSAKARFRSHRTIKLRPGSEVGELNG
ncbi:hypothetical protein FGIG_07968, partial [Fasciola gigantica]